MISHLLFADVTILFVHDNPNSMRELLRILSVYEAPSGQQVNLSSVFFSPGISQGR